MIEDKSFIEKLRTISGYVSMILILGIFLFAKYILKIPNEADRIAFLMVVIVIPLFIFVFILIPIRILLNKKHDKIITKYNRSKFNKVFVITYLSLLTEAFFFIPLLAVVAILSKGNTINESLIFPAYLFLSNWSKISLKKGWFIYPIIAFFGLVLIFIVIIVLSTPLILLFHDSQTYVSIASFIPKIIFLLLAFACSPLPQLAFNSMSEAIIKNLSKKENKKHDAN